MPTKFTEQQFWSLVRKDADGCWRWLGERNPAGYGVLTSNLAGSRYAHRTAYILTRGPVPEGLDLDHTCRTRRCVNPAHLDPVTHYVNMRRGKQANQTHCKWGHELSGDNLIIRERNNGKAHTYRQCREGLRRRSQEQSRRQPA